MADQQPVPQRRFKTRAGIQRKTAEERAAFVQAEAQRQEQHPSPSFPSQAPRSRRRSGNLGQNTLNVKNQNVESVFGSGATATGSKTRDKSIIDGTEQLLERGEADPSPAVEVGKGNRKTDPKTTKRATTKAPKNAAKPNEVLSLPDDDDQANAVDIDDIERILDVSDEEMGEHDDDDDVIVTHARRVTRTPKPNVGLRPVRAARDPPPDENDQQRKPIKARRPGNEKGTAPLPQDSDDILELDHDGIAISSRPLTPPAQDEAVAKTSPTKRRRKSSIRESRPQFDTLEERGEKERYAAELRMMQKEFSLPTTSDYQSESKSKSTFPPNPEAHRLYLFQFPPLTPMLTPQPVSTSEIKAEKETSAITISDSPTRPTASSSQNPPSQPPSNIKREKEKETPVQITLSSSDINPEKRNILTALNDPALPAGLAGRLNVHRSGRVTIEWGCADIGTTDTNPSAPLAPPSISTTATSTAPAVPPAGKSTTTTTATALPASTVANLELKWGTDVDFLQDVVQLDDPSVDGDGDRGYHMDDDGDIDMEGRRVGDRNNKNKAWALSQVRNKFVVVPDWGRIFE